MTSTNSPDAQWAKLAKRLDTIKPAIGTFTFCADQDLRLRLAQAKADAADADAAYKTLSAADEATQQMYKLRAEAAQTELAEAQKAFDKVAIVLRFKALPRPELEALQNAHPAGEEQEAKGEDYEMDTFAPALISAASMDGMPVEYARHALDTWGAAEAQQLWQAAWGIQQRTRTDLGKG
ncbi:hypothetical protein [Streptomyces olivaceiscleroticus]|uniref:Tail assembly chaperone n=1 Tax=Streptomyces olivaceiscleroticus TaxID=68245 RepID=A0ABN1BNC6_9ACTN